MVGSALLRAFRAAGFTAIITATKGELDLRDSRKVKGFFEHTSPECVVLAAAKVGGIQANLQFPADFIYDNISIQTNVIHQSYLSRVKRIIFLGSSCIYPRDCAQPMKEEYMMTGSLEPTNEAYAIAKIAGIKMVQYYRQQHGLPGICLMPCNLYGPKDSYDPKTSHVLSALVKRFVDAVDELVKRFVDAVDEKKDEVVLWGSGIGRREFLHVDDLAKAALFLMEKWDSPEIINVGSGQDISIQDLAELVANKVGYSRRIAWDTNMPDGMLRKCLDTSRLTGLGFSPSIRLSDGIDGMISDYRSLKSAGTP
jgi:GDP-L-fucose synthase